MVDRIMEEDRERGYIRGEKAVTATEWYFQGHFPQFPVMPGVLQVEALAQTMAVYVARQEGFGDRIGLFAAIDEVRFKRIVQPGDRLSLEDRPWRSSADAWVVVVPWRASTVTSPARASSHSSSRLKERFADGTSDLRAR